MKEREEPVKKSVEEEEQHSKELKSEQWFNLACYLIT